MTDTVKFSAKFSEFVKLKRKEKKIKIKELKANSGLSRAFINLVENNKSSPSLESATRHLSGVGESWESFLNYADNKNEELENVS